MTSGRITSLVLLAGAIAGGLVFQAADHPVAPAGTDVPAVRAGVALPAARTEPSLTSTWYCAGGSAAATSDEFADHVILLANPTDRARKATVTVLGGKVAPAPAPETTTTVPGDTTTSTAPAETTTTVAPAETTTTAPTAPPPPEVVDLPAYSRVEVRLGDVAPAELAGAVVEVDGGEIAVEHQITGSLGRATAPCSTTASATWSFPWGVTARGARELLVFMNPFPDDATVDIVFATDEGVREAGRLQGFVVPGQSVVGVYIDEDTRRDQVSAQVTVRGGRLVADRIQTFDGTDGREGITLALGEPTPALTWIYPAGETGPGLTEQVVVFNPGEDVAEVEVEVRLDDPQTNPPPEHFSLTVQPGRYSIIDVHAEDRVPAGVGHALIVRSLNGVPITSERVIAAADPAPRRGIGVTSGSPLGAPTWYFPGGGPIKDERDEYLVLFNVDDDDPVRVDVTGFSKGQTLAIQDLQGLTIPAGGRVVLRLGDHIDREDLPVVVTADGPIVAERGLYRIGGSGLSMSMGIPLAGGVVVPDPVAG